MIPTDELPDDEMYETVDKIGKLKHELLYELERPLELRTDPDKLADAMMLRYQFKSFNRDDLKLLMEMSEFWFEYKVDDDGNATSTPLDWSHIIKSDAS